jgi:3',5'-cyclic AMP phosphodiesterase CpdA
MREGPAATIQAELATIVDRFSDGASPDHVFVLGDLIEHGADAATDREYVDRVHSTLASSAAPVTYLLGNHDVENLDREALSELLTQSTFQGTETVDDLPVVYLDSTRPDVPGARGELGTDQLAAVDEFLDDAVGNDTDGPGALVLSHHPVGPVDLADNAWFSEFPERAYLGDRKELLTTLTRRIDDVRATVAGHVHDTQRASFWGLDHVTVGPVSKRRPGDRVTGTYAEVVVEDGTTTVDVRIGDQVRESYTLSAPHD